MRLNPIVEESLNIYLRTKKFRRLHAIFLGTMTFATIAVWPTRGIMEFFGGGTVPATFEALAVFQLLAISGISLYIGLDRIAGSEIIRYSEWLDRTTVPVRTLIIGKLSSAIMHTIVLMAMASPFLFIAAGPAGIPVRAILSVQWIVLLVAIFCRSVGMLISFLGENRDVVRVVGSWIFLALIFLVTIQLTPPLNPIIAVLRQQNESSLLVSTVESVPFRVHPAVPSSIYLLSGIALAIAGLGLGMRRHRLRWSHRTSHG